MPVQPCCTAHKETGRIDWTKTAREIDCLVRGATPWPGAFTATAEGVIKIFSVKPLHRGPSGVPGEIVAADARTGLVVACGDDDVELETIQMPGAKRMNAKDYLRGHDMQTAICLGKA